MRDREQDERAGISGGRFVEPAANRILPPVRTTRIEVDWENAYHFGGQVTSVFGKRREDE